MSLIFSSGVDILRIDVIRGGKSGLAIRTFICVVVLGAASGNRQDESLRPMSEMRKSPMVGLILVS